MSILRKVLGYYQDTAATGRRAPVEFDLDLSTQRVGSVPATSTGVSAVEYGGRVLHQTVITLAGVSITMTDATTAGCHGSIQLYDFPEALVNLVGACMSLTLTAGAGGIGDTAAAVAAVGTSTVATDNATLVGTGEANIIPSTAYTLVGGVKAATGVSTTALLAVADGSGTAKAAWLNIAVPDADSSASDTFTVDGTVTITWLHLGDV